MSNNDEASSDGKAKGLFGRFFKGRRETPAEPQTSPAAEPDTEQRSDPAAAGEQEVLRQPEIIEAGVPSQPATDVGQDVASPTSVDPAATAQAATELSPAKVGWFKRLTSGLGKTSNKLSDGITSIFTKRKLDADTLEDLEDLLIQSDIGVPTAQRICDAIGQGRFEKGIAADDVRQILAAEVERVLTPVARPLAIDATRKPHVIMMVGVNGTGKTTTIGKLAKRMVGEGKTVLLAAGDTFRAAAIDQLQVWGERTQCDVISRPVGSDSSALAFDALKIATERGVDVLLLDTAGRLQNKRELMEELKKVTRVLKKQDPSAPHDVILVLDATTGQNALSQVDVFSEQAGVTGLVMTKLDGTARGGIIVAIAEKTGLPVHAIGVGEGADDLQPFEAADFARAIAQTS